MSDVPRIATKTSACTYCSTPNVKHPHEIEQLVPAHPGDFDYDPLAPPYPVPTMVWSKGSSYKTDYYRQRPKTTNPQPTPGTFGTGDDEGKAA